MHKVRLMVILILCLGLLNSLYAQESSGGNDLVKDSLTDITVIAAAGVTGAILGISTLPFVDEPSKHLKNILYGGSIGIILGVGFVAYSQAIKGKSSVEGGSSSSQFDTIDRYSWHTICHQSLENDTIRSNLRSSMFNYSFTF